MKNIAIYFLLAALLIAGLFFLNWYSFAIILFLAGMIITPPKKSSGFLQGFLLVFITWMMLNLIQDFRNDSILSKKMAILFYVNNPYILFIITSALFGVIGGCAMMAGRSIRRLI